MALPTSRNTTYVLGVNNVKATDLNDIQDWLIALHSGRHASQTLPIPASAGSPTRDALSYSGVGSSAGVAVDLSGGSDEWIFPIVLPVGARISEVRGYVKDNATGTTTVTMELNSNPMTTTARTGHGSVASVGNGSDQTIAVSSLAVTIAAGKVYEVRMTTSAANVVNLYGIEVDYDNP